MQFNFKEYSIYPSSARTELLDQKKEELGGVVWSKTLTWSPSLQAQEGFYMI